MAATTLGAIALILLNLNIDGIRGRSEARSESSAKPLRNQAIIPTLQTFAQSGKIDPDPRILGNDSNIPLLELGEVIRRETRKTYIFRLDAGKATLVESSDITGEFRPSNGKLVKRTGRLYYVLLDSRGNMIAEETTPAYDYNCTMLEGGPDGTRHGNETAETHRKHVPTIVDVILPKAANAKTLNLYRLTGSSFNTPEEDLKHDLLGSFILP